MSTLKLVSDSGSAAGKASTPRTRLVTDKHLLSKSSFRPALNSLGR
jgi:hypothetical protein